MRLGPIALALALSAASDTFAAAKKSQPKAPPPAPEPAAPSEAEAAPVEPKKESVEPAPRPAPAHPPAAPAAEAAAAPKPKAPGTFDRIGVSVDLFYERSHMGGEQWINQFRADESFDYGAGPVAVTAYVLLRVSERFRLGPSVRFLGNYGGGGGDGFTFGYLAEASLLAELALNVVEQFEALFGGRAGASVLFPGSEFSDEIRRLQAQGAGVWSLPRVGWIAGLNVGVRRRLIGVLFARIDIEGQLGHQWLFSTDEIVDGLRFRKYWGIDVRRLGGRLAFEVSF